MLRNLLRFQSIGRRSTTVASSFFRETKSVYAGRKPSKNNSNNIQWISSIREMPSAVGMRASFLSTLRSYSTVNNTAESVENLLSQANAYIQNRNLNSALEYAAKAVERSKTPDEILNSLTLKLPLQMVAGQAGWDNEFIATIKRLDLESPQFHEIWERLMGTLVSSFKAYNPECKSFFEKALKAFPNNFIVTLKEAEVLLSFKMVNEAENSIKKAIAIDSYKCRPWVLLWHIHPSNDKFLTKAIECSDSEKDTLLWSEYAKKQIFQDNNVDAGIESLKKAAADRPILPGVEQALNTISTQLAVKGDAVSAEKVVRLWIEESPRNAAAWSILGSLNNAQKRPQDAEKCFRKAIELNSSLVSAWFNLGNMLPPTEGIPMLLQALKLSPKLHTAHYRLAMHYRDLGLYDSALESINKAIELNNQASDYHVLKSMITASMPNK